jgi:hypothetical protein
MSTGTCIIEGQTWGKVLSEQTYTGIISPFTTLAAS